MAKFPDLNRLVRVSWGMTPLAQIIFGSNNSMCNCDITLTNAVQLSNKTMDYNENTFLNFPILPKNISSPANNDLLRYSSSDGKWHNVELVAGSNITVTQNTNNITIAATGGASTFAGLSDVSLTAFSSDPNNLYDGVPVVWNSSKGKWDRAGYDDNQRVHLTDSLTLFSNGGNNIFAKLGFAAVTGSNGDIISYNFPNLRFSGNRPGSVVVADDGDTGAVILGSNSLNSGAHTATITALTGKPGATDVTDAAGWIQVKINGTYYAMPVFAL